MQFNMDLLNADDVALSSSTASSSSVPVSASHPPLGPIVDGSAPCSAILVTELCVLRSSLCLPHFSSYDPVPAGYARYKY